MSVISSSFTIPIDPNFLLRKKKAIKRTLLTEPGLLKKKIAILGGSTTAEIKDILELFLLESGIAPEFYECDFNQYFEEIMFENAALKAFAPDVVFIHTTHVNIRNFPALPDSEETVARKLQDEIDLLEAMWERLKAEYGCTIIQNNYELPFARPLGNLDFSDLHGKTHFIAALNQHIARHAQENTHFLVHDIHYLSSWIGLEKWHNRQDWYAYKYALGLDCIPAFAQNLAAILKALFGNSKKALVLDLDNTLWGGVIGDDGVNQIKIGSGSALAEAYTDFQAYVRDLRDRGIILTVASKNELQNAKEGFAHPDSTLRFDDFASFQANWDPKSASIRTIARDVNIGLDSMVFVDDNPAERELVRQQVPEIVVPEMGDNIVQYIALLDKSGLFEATRISAEDRSRHQFYQQNATRAEQSSQFHDYGQYLASLSMHAHILPFDTANLERITQLINKTNQFNLTTRRYTQAEVAGLIDNPQHVALHGRLSDKFGDNGLITAMVGRLAADVLHIELWIMSCRVLKRGMEFAMFDELVRRASALGATTITGAYIKTAKNDMVSALYRDLGFELAGGAEGADSHWTYSVRPTYQDKNSYIKVNHES